MKYETSQQRFTIFSEQDAPVNQYRVRNRDLEFRVLGPYVQRFRAHWRKLTADEIALHMNLNTAVAEWLNARLLRRAGLFFMPLELSLREATAVAWSGR
ncbi:MAG TPA: hypothetical protein VF493_12045 [Terriglobales bacterium]